MHKQIKIKFILVQVCTKVKKSLKFKHNYQAFWKLFKFVVILSILLSVLLWLENNDIQFNKKNIGSKLLLCTQVHA